MKSFKVNIAVMAFLLGSAIALSQSAFISAKTVKKGQTGTEYQFNGTSVSQEKTASDYSVVSGSGPSCDDNDVLVCTINVTGDLQTWLNNHTDAEILGAADQTRD
jgi:hypothetical protein